MKLRDIEFLCENQYKYRIDKVLNTIRKKLMEFEDVMQQRFNRISRFNFAGIYRDVLVYREELTDEVMDVLMNSDNYVYCFDRAQKMLTDDEINIIKGGGVIDVVKQLDIEMNDLGIEGESEMWFDKEYPDECCISCEYIKEDLIQLVKTLDRYNKKDVTLEFNINILRDIVYDISDEVKQFLNLNKQYFRRIDVYGDVQNDYRSISIVFDILVPLNDKGNWSMCKLPEYMYFRPTIRTGGEEFLYCIGEYIASKFNIRNKVTVKQQQGNSFVMVIKFLRSDLRGKELSFGGSSK